MAGCSRAANARPPRVNGDPRRYLDSRYSFSIMACCSGPKSASLPASPRLCSLPFRRSWRCRKFLFSANATAHVRLSVALLVGLAGVAVLVSRSLNLRRRANRKTRRCRADLCLHQLVARLDPLAQTAAARIQSDEFWRADACRWSVSHRHRRPRSVNFTISIRRPSRAKHGSRSPT